MFSYIQPSFILICLLFTGSRVQAKNLFFADGQKETLSRLPAQAASDKPVSIPFSIKAATTGVPPKTSKAQQPGVVPAATLASTLVASIGFGSPPQQLSILLDTGSTLFWVRSTKCRSSFCNGKPMFNSESSSSFQQGPSPGGNSSSQTITYGDGTRINCTVSQDTVAFGDLKIVNQNICEATLITTSTAETDGIMGVGPPNGRTSAADFMKTFNSQFSTTIMSFWYNSDLHNVGADATSGEITLGGLNPARYEASSPIVWASISDDRRYWILPLTSLKNSTNDSIFPANPIPLIIDTGTTQNLLPNALAAQFNNQIGAKMSAGGQYTMDCAGAKKIQTFTFTFSGNAVVTLSGSELVFRAPSSSICYSIFQPSDGSISIVGAWFLRNFYTVFDYQQARIGFGVPTYSGNSTTPSPSPTAPNPSLNQPPLMTPPLTISKNNALKSAHTAIMTMFCILGFI